MASSPSTEPEGYLDRAKAYWRFAPGGSGKVDSSDLLRLPDDRFLATWRNEKRIRRLVHWEEAHFIEYFREHSRGRRVFSFGCGLGYSELDLLDAGAWVTFADIVPSAVACVERVCRLSGYADRSRFAVMDDSAAAEFGGPYEIVFAYGSLMHMPAARQERVIERMRLALAPGGRIWLMLYTPKFVQSTGSTFDEVAFGRHSDPAAGDLENPWSDWHDDEKLQRLAGPELRITKRETYNEERYVWYQLERTADAPASAVTTFVDLPRIETARMAHELESAELLVDLDMKSAGASDARIRRKWSGALAVTTGASQFHYAVTFPAVECPAAQAPNRLVVDAEIERGGFAISLLDVTENQFFYTASIERHGAVRAWRDLSALTWPATYQVVISNYSPSRAATSVFLLRRIALLRSDGT